MRAIKFHAEFFFAGQSLNPRPPDKCAEIPPNDECWLKNRPVSQEEGLSSPLDGDALADRDVVQVDLDLGHGQNVLRGGHAEK